MPLRQEMYFHSGQLIEDVGDFWEHAEHRHKRAHDYLSADYVCPWASRTVNGAPLLWGWSVILKMVWRRTLR